MALAPFTVDGQLWGLPAWVNVTVLAYDELAGAERVAAYHDTLQSSAVPSFQRRVRIEDGWGWLSLGWYWLADAYQHIVRDGVPVETALQEAQASADAYRACLLARLEIIGSDSNCFREVDPQLAQSLFGPPR